MVPDTTTTGPPMIEPVATVEITARERTRLMCETTFRLTTIVPTIERPHRNVYVLDQRELQDLLADLMLRAEYVITVEEVSGFPDLLRRLGDGVPS
jgi:hypothetical protein